MCVWLYLCNVYCFLIHCNMSRRCLVLKEYLCGEYFREIYLCSPVEHNPEAVQLTLVFKVTIYRQALIAPRLPRPEGIPTFLLIFEYNKYSFSNIFALKREFINHKDYSFVRRIKMNTYFFKKSVKNIYISIYENVLYL